MGQFICDLEDNAERANKVIDYWITHREIFSLGQYQRKINAVTAEDVQRVAQKYFTADNANLAWVGAQEPDINQLEEILEELG